MTEKTARPLSPHLQVYKPQLTSVTSILHRLSGVALSIGLVLFTWWLVAASIGPGAYDTFMTFAGCGWVKLALGGFTAAFYYHFANGIRHLIWDSGKLFKLEHAYAAGYTVLFFTVIMTAITWFCIFSMKSFGGYRAAEAVRLQELHGRSWDALDCQEPQDGYDVNLCFRKACLQNSGTKKEYSKCIEKNGY